jgi:hypothetical protein
LFLLSFFYKSRADRPTLNVERSVLLSKWHFAVIGNLGIFICREVRIAAGHFVSAFAVIINKNTL